MQLKDINKYNINRYLIFILINLISFSLLLNAQINAQSVTVSTALAQPFPGQRITSVLSGSTGIVAAGLNGYVLKYLSAPLTYFVTQATSTNYIVNISYQYPSFSGNFVNRLAYDPTALTEDFFAIGKGGYVAKYKQSGTVTYFSTFTAGNAKALAVDNSGRLIVGGFQGLLVRYTKAGVIDLTFSTFPGYCINDIAIDYLGRIIAVGRAGTVVRYLPTGTIDLTYATFPGGIAKTVIVDVDGNAYVGGKSGTIVRYNTLGQIDETFDTFPGYICRDLLMLTPGYFPSTPAAIMACGNAGTVCQYDLDGNLNYTYPTFTGQRAQSMTLYYPGTYFSSRTLATDAVMVGGNAKILMAYNGINGRAAVTNYGPFIEDWYCSNSVKPAGSITIRGGTIPGFTVSLFINGTFYLSTVADSQGSWSITRTFAKGKYTLQAVGFYQNANIRTAPGNTVTLTVT